MKFRVLSDSSCDITKEQEERYHIGIIPYYVSMDGVHYKKDRVEITAEEFYREMAENPGVYPKTSTPTQVDLNPRLAVAFIQLDCKIQQFQSLLYADCGGADGGIPCLQNHRS